MNVSRITLLVASILVLQACLFAQNKAFDDSVLTGAGRGAYQTLLKMKLFAMGGIGYGGETSPGEKALDVLIEEKEAVAAFKGLIDNATIEGGFYGLFGLKMLGCDCFDSEVANYKAKHFSSTDTETFTTQSGCFWTEAKTAEDKNFVLNFYLDKVFEAEATDKECRRLTNGRTPDIYSKCLEKRKNN